MFNTIIQQIDLILFIIGLVCLLTILLPFCPMTIDLVMLSRDAQVSIYRNRMYLWVIGCLSLTLVFMRALPGGAADLALIQTLQDLVGAGDGSWLLSVLITSAMLTMMFWTGYVPFVMTPPEQQQLLNIEQADELVTSEDVVLGLVRNGEARAYPRDMIARPHFIKDKVGETPIMVSYCILCNSAMALLSQIKGRDLNLQCLTAYNNNIIYHEPDQGNYIQQLDGKVFLGPDAGAKLDQLPVIIATWGEWKKLHPATKLLFAPSNTLRDKIVDAMLKMMIPIRKLSVRTKPWHRIRGVLDTRLGAMSYVLGVEINGEQCGYPIAELKNKPVINDVVGGQAIVALYNDGLDIADVFKRDLNDQQLTFKPAQEAQTDIVAQDEETGSCWNILGQAVSGEFKGQSLTAQPHYNRLFWFSWALFKPKTKLFAQG